MIPKQSQFWHLACSSDGQAEIESGPESISSEEEVKNFPIRTRKILPAAPVVRFAVAGVSGFGPEWMWFMASPEFGALMSPAAPRISGPRLAAIRQERGLSLEQIADTTKISVRFLRAIEAEKFEELPGGIFRTSYLRQYARCVECDEGELLARFNEKMNPGEPAAPETPSDGRRLLHWWFRR